MAEPAEYPAAHSMDTNWFAVDAAGNVGLFDSNEGGAVPSAVWRSDTDVHHEVRLAQLVQAALRTKAVDDRELAKLLPADHEDELWDQLSFSFLRAARARQFLGLWSYYCDEQQAAPYIRHADPAQPLKLADLREHGQDFTVDVFLPVEFESMPLLQPPEHVDSSIWGRFWPTLDGGVIDSGTREPTTDDEDTAWGRALVDRAQALSGNPESISHRQSHYGREYHSLVEFVDMAVASAREGIRRTAAYKEVRARGFEGDEARQEVERILGERRD